MIFCIASIFFLMIKFDKIIHNFEQKRKLYVTYLIETNDINGLKKIGEINIFGQHERWYPNYNSILKYLKEKSLTDKKTEEYLSVFEQYKDKYIKFLLGIMTFFFIFYICLENITNNTHITFVLLAIVLFSILIFLAYLFKKNEN